MTSSSGSGSLPPVPPASPVPNPGPPFPNVTNPAALAPSGGASSVNTNVDVAALIQAAVDAALAKREAEIAAANVAAVETPEQASRRLIDARGAGKGIEERFSELYDHLALLAEKVGF